MTQSIKTFFALLLVSGGFPTNDAKIDHMKTLVQLVDSSKLLPKYSTQTNERTYQTETNKKINEIEDSNENIIKEIEAEVDENNTSLESTKLLNKCIRGDSCTLSGSIRIVTGVNWTSELLNTQSEQFLSLELEVNTELQKSFLASYLRSGFVESRVEGFRFQDLAIVVDFYVLFDGLRYDVDAKEIGNIVRDSLDIIEEEAFLGKFNIDEHSTTFRVIDQNVKMIGKLLPKWGWVLVTLGLFSIVLTSLICIFLRLKKFIKKKQTKKPSELDQTIKSLKKNLEEKQARESAILSETIQSLKRMATNRKTSDQRLKTISNFAKNYNVYNKNMHSKVDMWSVLRMAEKAPSLINNLPDSNLPINTCCTFCRHGQE